MTHLLVTRFAVYLVLGLLTVMIPSCGQVAREPDVDIKKSVEEAKASGRGAKLVCDEEEHNFGTVWSGAKLCHKFKLTNIGGETAHVRTTPGVAGVGFGKYFDVEPGETYDFESCLNSHKLFGPFHKIITVDLMPESYGAKNRCPLCRLPLESVGHERRCGPMTPNP